ncbi:creatininase family protein [Tabrizicola sp.]|uniref:creatininase family protein n=1 Tax=Tabrizicola sp. TaxID=2005166 RepID=UPI002FDE29BE
MIRQIERLRPHQITEALREASLIYLPLGTIEWHCHHLPVGLDALTAHGLCLQAAERTGGLVWPALYYGTGGDHGDFPWTVMMPDATEIEGLLTFTLRRLGDLGVKHAVLFSGHFAETQLEMIDRIAAQWNLRHDMPKVTALSVNQAPVPGLSPDHAGLFETTLLDGVAPGLSDIGRLSSDPDTMHRFDPYSPLWGIVGADPRQTPPMAGAEICNRVAAWMENQVIGTM